MKKRRLVNLLEDVRRTISVDQPKLEAKLETNGVLVSGTYILKPVEDEHINWGAMAEYQIRILFPSTFPKKPPIVHETGDAIPHDEDYHINPDGTCCIVIWGEWAFWNDEVSVQSYFDIPLRNFFLGQLRKKQTGKWPFGEECHGKAGLIDTISNRLSCLPNEKEIRNTLRVLSKGKIKDKWPCPCGRGRVIKECCLNRLIKLREKIPKQYAQEMLSQLKYYNRNTTL